MRIGYDRHDIDGLQADRGPTSRQADEQQYGEDQLSQRTEYRGQVRRGAVLKFGLGIRGRWLSRYLKFCRGNKVCNEAFDFNTIHVG